MQRYVDDFIIPLEKIFYLDYGFPLHYLRPENHSKQNVITFGYIGTHIPAKGINLLLDAFSKVEGEAELLIFGRTNGQNTTALKSKATHLKIDCIVVPSIWGENSPLVIHEAQACHIPVITANFGGMSEYVEHHINGLLFKHRDMDSLTEQLNFAIKNREFMQELGKKGYLYNKNGAVPSIENHCNELMKHYHKIAQNEE
jgi:glycosyltransferase involved in cell wall biosynthesis